MISEYVTLVKGEKAYCDHHDCCLEIINSRRTRELMRTEGLKNVCKIRRDWAQYQKFGGQDRQGLLAFAPIRD